MEDLKEKIVTDADDELSEEELEELNGGVTVVSGKRPLQSDKSNNSNKKK